MPLGLAFTDGSSLYGLDTITINGVVFYANSLSSEAAIEVKNLLNEVGAARKAVGVNQKRTGVYEIQIDSEAAILSCSAASSMSIQAEDTPSGSTFTAYITGRSLARSNENFATMTLNWEEKLN